MKSKLRSVAAFVCLSAIAGLSAIAAQTQHAQTQHAQAQPAQDRAAQSAAAASGIVGEWQGALEVPGSRLRLVLRLLRQGGGLSGSLDSPDQGEDGLPISDVTFADRALHFVLPNPQAPASYDGTLSADGARIDGYWSQSGARLPLSFARPGASARSSETPQTLTRGRVRFSSCARESLKGALCAKYEVFENRAAKSGRKIALNIVMLPALAAKPAPDAVFYFAGGPGAAASTYASQPFMTLLRRTRDVVMVDQRGTGDSNPLRCDVFGDPNDMRGYFGDTFSDARVRACRAELEKIADLRLYTTPIAMADLEEVREAMGYDKIDVMGGSYGSTAALAYLRLYPQRVRAAAVSGVAPVDYKMALPFAKGVEHGLERVFSDCAADPKCNAAYSNARQDFAQVIARLAKGPVEFEATNPSTGQKQQITLTRESFMEHIRVTLYLPEMMAYLPFFIHEMAGGNFARFAANSYRFFRLIDDQIARGMHLSVVCTESIPYISEDEIKRETAGTFYGDARLRAYQRSCALWPKGDVPASFRDARKLDVPVLMISGDFDPVTPPFVGAAALAQYTQGKQIVVRNGTHAPYECTDRLMVEFIERGTWQGLDTSCVDQVQRLPFYVPPPAAGSTPQ